MMLQRICNELVTEARKDGCSVIAFEGLAQASVTELGRREATNERSSDCMSMSNTKPPNTVSTYNPLGGGNHHTGTGNSP